MIGETVFRNRYDHRFRRGHASDGDAIPQLDVLCELRGVDMSAIAAAKDP